MFQELLDLPQIQSLVGTTHEPTYRLLQCFAYGTVRQYKGSVAAFAQTILAPCHPRLVALTKTIILAQAANLPELKAEQKRKLQLLSIVFLCCQSKARLVKISLQPDTRSHLPSCADSALRPAYGRG